MADKTQINLERIRACDAEWDESKHKRADNGQFTSGGGATVIKAQSGGKAKVQQLKNVVFPACAGVILKAGRLITVFSKNEFDDEIRKKLEVAKNGRKYCKRLCSLLPSTQTKNR